MSVSLPEDVKRPLPPTDRPDATSLAPVIGADAVYWAGANGTLETLVPVGADLHVLGGTVTLPEPVILTTP